MSGLNKQKKLFRKQLFIILAVYLLLLIGVGLTVSSLPQISNQTMNHKVVKIKKEIADSINNPSRLEKLNKQEALQLIVKEQDKIIYSNMPINDYTILEQVVAKDSIFYKEVYQINNYDVYLLVYNQVPQQLMTIVTILILAVMLIITIVMILLIRLSFKSLLKPLDSLYSNLEKLKKYKFDDVLTTDQKTDLYLEELNEFVQDIQGKVKDFEIVYSSLEKELLVQNKNMEYKTNVIASLVHDLKTPLNVIKLSVTNLRKYDSLDEKMLNNINDGADDVIVDIDNILKVAYQKEIKHHKENLDFIKKIKESINMFSSLYRSKGLSFNIELLFNAKIVAYEMEIETILKNIFSNAYTYALANSEVAVVLTSSASEYCLEVSNEVNEITKVDFERAFSLLNKNTHNSTSSGLGLYLVKEFAGKNGGTCSFYPDGNKVVLELRLPKDGDDYEKVI